MPTDNTLYDQEGDLWWDERSPLGLPAHIAQSREAGRRRAARRHRDPLLPRAQPARAGAALLVVLGSGVYYTALFLFHVVSLLVIAFLFVPLDVAWTASAFLTAAPVLFLIVLLSLGFGVLSAPCCWRSGPNRSY